MKKHKYLIISVSMAPLAISSISAYADVAPKTDVTVGIAAQETTKYSGSNQSTYSILPYLKVQHGNFYLDSEKGVGYQYEWDNGLYLGQSFGYYLGRKEKNSDWSDGSKKLKGMGNIDAVINSTSTLGWQFDPYLSFEGNFIAPITDSQGLQYNFGLKFRVFETSTDTLNLSTKANFGDSRYINTFYGVNATQSKNSGYSEYKTNGGLYSYDADLEWTHAFNDNWWSYADLNYTQLTSKAKNSPIVKSSGNTSLTLGLFYSF